MVLHLIPEMAFLMEAGWMIGQTEVVDPLIEVFRLSFSEFLDSEIVKDEQMGFEVSNSTSRTWRKHLFRTALRTS